MTGTALVLVQTDKTKSAVGVLPSVFNVRVPLFVAVQTNHTELVINSGAKVSSGKTMLVSPIFKVARVLSPLVLPDAPVRIAALAKLSLAGWAPAAQAARSTARASNGCHHREGRSWWVGIKLASFSRIVFTTFLHSSRAGQPRGFKFINKKFSNHRPTKTEITSIDLIDYLIKPN